METKSIVIFGMGVIAGYLLTNYMNSLPKSVPVSEQNTGQSKLEYCKQEAENLAMSVKLSEGDLEAFKQEQINACMNRDVMPESQPISVTISSGEPIMG